MSPKLTPELEQALKQNDGIVEGRTFVLMSIDLYRDKFQSEADVATDDCGDEEWTDLRRRYFRFID